MALPVLDVTGRDFDTLVPILRDRALSQFPNLPNTDFNFSSFMGLFIDLFAGVGDGLNFYIDNVAQDHFWETVRDRENAIRLGEGIGFRFRAASAAQVTLRFTITLVAPGDVTIPARTKVKTNDPINPLVFETMFAGVIPAGSLFVDIPAENAELKEEDFVSDSQPFQQFTVENVPFVEGSSEVTVGVDEWAEVDDFFNSKTIDKHYIAQVDANERLVVEFGDGQTGAVPVGDINVKYKTGGGLAGNVFPNTIKVLETQFTDEFSNSVNMSVTNLAAAAGGQDKMSIAEARFEAPRSVKTNLRTIAEEDFEIHATQVGGVSRAKVFTADQNPLIPENTGFLYIVPVGGGTPSLALRDEVFDYITDERPLPIGFVLNVVAPTFIPIGFTMRIWVKDASFKATVHQALQAAFTEYFSESITTGEEAGQPNRLMDFAKQFFNSEVTCIAQDTHEQIRNVELITDMEATYDLEAEEFPTKGVLIFLDGATAFPLP